MDRSHTQFPPPTTPNHPSATDYPDHIREFIDKEMDLGGLVGPYEKPPFVPWCHVSPLMSREKGDTGKRRVITDMTYPAQASINAYIVKNGVYGFENHHSLPTVDRVADDLREMGKGVFMSSMDVARAYKNFTSDPLDLCPLGPYSASSGKIAIIVTCRCPSGPVLHPSTCSQ